MSDFLWPHELQHTKLLCPSLSPGVGSNSCPFIGWGHPTITFCHSLLLLASIFPSIRVFSNESALCNKWSKYWSFTISASSKYSGLISFRIYRLDLLPVQGTLKSLLQHQKKASILWHSAFFIVQLSPEDGYWKKSYLWLYKPSLAKWNLCFRICCLGLS